MCAMTPLEKFEEARAKMLGDSAARQRLNLLLDEGSFVELDGFASVDGEPAGVVCGFGSVTGSPVAVFSQDISAGGGAVGAVHAAKICKVYDTALKTGVPVIGIYDSHGARIREGAAALAAYGDILLRANNLSGVVPQISLVLGVCAGTSAMLAASADFVVMSEKAEFFMAAPAAAIDPASEQETAGAGTAANAAKAGVAHVVAKDDAEACETARKLISMLPLNNLASPPVSDFTQPGAVCAAGETDIRKLAEAVCDAGSAVELLGGFGSRIYTALATMGGFPCGIVVTNGKLCANCCAKIAKVVSVLDSFQIPVVTLVNSDGMKSSAKAELSGSIREMAKLAHVYAEATTAKVAVITGNACGAAYVALAGRSANSDYTVAWPSAVISALEPQTAVALLYADRITADNPREAVEREYAANEASALQAAKDGYIDDVIAPELTRPAILSALDLLSAKRVSKNPKKHGNIPM